MFSPATQLEESTARAEAALAAEKEVWAEKTRVATEEVDALEARLHQLKTADKSSLAESQRTLEDLSMEYQVCSCCPDPLLLLFV
eukprot:SAG11_NODE_4046_length_2088_cov_1.206134_5_plen_85_part_00